MINTNFLYDLTTQLKIESFFLSKDEVGNLLASRHDYTSKQKLSIVWRSQEPDDLTVRAWNVTDAGYEDERILRVRLPREVAVLIINKILKGALMNRFKIDDLDDIDFSCEDFIYPMNIELLSRTIKDDFPQLNLSNNDNTMNILNQVMRTPNLFELATEFKPSIMSFKRIIELVEKIKSHSAKSYDTIPEDDRKLLRKLNKLILGKLYPNKVPKKIPLDDLEVHHNIYFCDTFTKEHRLKSSIADVTWIGCESNKINLEVKNKSKKIIPFSSSDVRLVVDDDKLLNCRQCFYPPVGWFSEGSIDILHGMTVKAIFESEGLNKDTIIKRVIYRQNFYGQNGWFSCHSLFDFQLNSGE